MKKREIVELIKNKTIIKNSKLLKLWNSFDYEQKELFQKFIAEYENVRKQLERDSKARESCNNFKTICTCNHQIREKVSIEDDSFFGLSYYYECVFCRDTIPLNKENADWYDRHLYNNCVYLNNPKFDILDFILSLIQDKDDEDEIDFIEEFKTLEIYPSICTINDEMRPENYIMIIGDSIDSKQSSPKNELMILNSLSKIEEIRVQILSKYKVTRFAQYYRECSLPKNLCTSAYDYCWLDTIEKDKYYKIPFKIIINLNPNLLYYNRETKKDIPINIAL